MEAKVRAPVPGIAAFLRHAVLALLIAGLAACAARPPVPDQSADRPQPPSLVYPGLFEEVALARIFPDMKDWTDAVPRTAPETVLAAYGARAPMERTELKTFVAEYFEAPTGATVARVRPQGRSLKDHIPALWPELTRQATRAPPGSSLLPLPHPYIVPGGRFREIYYWDVYFTMLGLGPGHAGLKRHMVDNFAHLIDTYGHIPNGNRSYYLSRSQPPFFFKMVGLLAPGDEATAYADYLPHLKREYAFWMAGADEVRPGTAQARVVALAGGRNLNRYWDARDVPRDESYAADVETATASHRDKAKIYRDIRAAAESGWDFSSRWLDDRHSLETIRTTAIVPVDLNALLYGLERAIASGCRKNGDAPCADEFEDRAETRKAAMNAYLWNKKRGVFGDYDFQKGALRDDITAAALYPLFFGLASPEQAAATAKAVERALLAPGGLLATTYTTGQQWDAPNGWAPLQWIAVEGLSAYGHDALAREIARRWLATVARVYGETGKLVEKYDVTAPRPGGGGEYPFQDGFGWTNGVTAALLMRYPAFSSYGETVPRAETPKTGAR